MKKTLTFALILLLISIVGCSVKQSGDSLSDSEIKALNSAINDEYKARDTYLKVVKKFGDVKPFANILDSEENHIAQLEGLYEKYGLDIPADELYDFVPEFDSVEEACSAAANAEIDNAALYDTLLTQVDNEDVAAVFSSLRDASNSNHLPAFERCAGIN